MKLDGLAELTLRSDDPERLAEFYRSGFGMRRLDDERDRIWLAAGTTTRLGIWCPGTKEFGDQGGVHVHFAFSVEPGILDDIADRLGDLGVKVTGPIEHDGGDRSIY